MKAIRLDAGQLIDYTPPAGVAAGDVVVQGGLVGVAATPIPANTPGSLAVTGEFDILKAAVAITAGALVYWDAAAQVATNVVATNTLMGRAVRLAALGDARVRVLLTP
jgi:predicted RecA/RadA family phage recombinase